MPLGNKSCSLQPSCTVCTSLLENELQPQSAHERIVIPIQALCLFPRSSWLVGTTADVLCNLQRQILEVELTGVCLNYWQTHGAYQKVFVLICFAIRYRVKEKGFVKKHRKIQRCYQYSALKFSYYKKTEEFSYL